VLYDVCDVTLGDKQCMCIGHQANFSACPVWMHTQSNITNIIFTWVHNTNTHKKYHILEYIDIEGTKYHQLEPTWPRSSVQWRRQASEFGGHLRGKLVFFGGGQDRFLPMPLSQDFCPPPRRFAPLSKEGDIPRNTAPGGRIS
jgi:hypothetical protein